jgi:signal transduction histidine kinase
MTQDRRLVSAIHAMTSVLSSNPSIDGSLESILTVCVESVDATGGTIYLHDPRKGVLVFGYVLPPEMNAQLQGQSFPDTQGIAGSVFTNRLSRIDNDVAGASDHQKGFDKKTEHTTRSLVTVPLLVADSQPVGVVQVLNKRSGDFNEEDLVMLEIVGSVAAMAIQNAQLAEDAKKATGLAAMGDIAHDIKNKVAPLTMGAMTLMLDLEMLAPSLDGTGAADVLQSMKETAEIIASGAQKTHRYTQMIADLAKGKEMAIALQPADICAIASREFLTQQKLARTKGVELIADTAGPIMLQLDEVMVERAVYNLTINAVEATPEGGKVHMGIAELPDEVCLTIRDTGKGMPPERLAQVLAGTAESSKAGGTGLGTSIVRKIAEMHSGRLEAESTVGEGTTFRIYLPRA